MGLSIAKHRLEILKLVKKEEGVTAATRPNKKLSGAIKKYLRKCMSKLVPFREDDIVKKDTTTTTPVTLPEPDWCQGKWRGALVRKQQQGSEDLVKEENHHHHHHHHHVPMYRSKSIALSGPLDGRRMQHHHEKMVNNKALKLSGPIDGRMNERMMMYTNRSPLMPRTVDGRFSGTAKSPRVSGPLDARVMMVENRSPRVTTRPSDVTRAETNSPMGYNSPYNNNKPKADFDYDDDDDHTLWPTLFQDLKPT